MSHTKAQFVFCLVHFYYTKLHRCAMLLVVLVTRYTHRNMCSNYGRNNQRHRNEAVFRWMCVCMKPHLASDFCRRRPMPHKETRPVSSEIQLTREISTQSSVKTFN